MPKLPVRHGDTRGNRASDSELAKLVALGASRLRYGRTVKTTHFYPIPVVGGAWKYARARGHFSELREIYGRQRSVGHSDTCGNRASHSEIAKLVALGANPLRCGRSVKKTHFTPSQW